MSKMFNVASPSNLRAPVDQLYERFEAAGFPDHFLPDDWGWMRVDAFPDQIVGRIGIRDQLGELVAARIGRGVPYTRAQKCNFMREGRVLEQSDWPVMSIPAIRTGSLEAIADELVESKARRNRGLVTDCRPGSNITTACLTIGRDAKP